jgi:hypothetical protein
MQRYSLMYLLSVYISTQLIYMLVIIILRPFNSKKDNFVELMNELFYSGFCITLLFYNEEDHWSDSSTWWYLGFLLGNNFIISIISTVAMVVLIIKIWKEKLTKSKVMPRPHAYRVWTNLTSRFVMVQIEEKWVTSPPWGTLSRAWWNMKKVT